MANDSLEDTQYNAIFIRKSYEQQRDDLLKIIDFAETSHWIDMKCHWQEALEFVVDCVGWSALWKISRDSCVKFNICYPTTVVVKIENIDYRNLSTTVSLVMAEDDIPLPQTVSNVPMLHLFPTIQQEYSTIDIKRMAYILHDLRVFFNHLWRPWDELKVNSNSEWLSIHFENRLKLYYDISVGNVELKTLSTIENLTMEGHRLIKRINEIEEELMDDASALEDMRFLLLSQLQLKLSHLFDELTFFENKSNRDLLAKQQEIEEDSDQRQHVSVAGCGYDVTEFSSLSKKINKIFQSIDNGCFKGMWHLEKLICDASKTEKIYLGPGTFRLNSRTLLKNNNVLQGLDGRESTIITNSEEGLCLFETFSKNICINSVTLAPSGVQYGVIVCAGVCNLNDMKITGNEKSQIGIYVHSGAQLVAENCLFCDFSVAIHAKPNSSVLLKNCTFEDNENGIEFKTSNITIESCKFTGNTGYALLMVKPSATLGKPVEGSPALEVFEGVKLIGTTFDKNKCDTAVKWCIL